MLRGGWLGKKQEFPQAFSERWCVFEEFLFLNFVCQFFVVFFFSYFVFNVLLLDDICVFGWPVQKVPDTIHPY